MTTLVMLVVGAGLGTALNEAYAHVRRRTIRFERIRTLIYALDAAERRITETEEMGEHADAEFRSGVNEFLQTGITLLAEVPMRHYLQLSHWLVTRPQWSRSEEWRWLPLAESAYREFRSDLLRQRQLPRISRRTPIIEKLVTSAVFQFWPTSDEEINWFFNNTDLDPWAEDLSRREARRIRGLKARLVVHRLRSVRSFQRLARDGTIAHMIEPGPLNRRRSHSHSLIPLVPDFDDVERYRAFERRIRLSRKIVRRSAILTIYSIIAKQRITRMSDVGESISGFKGVLYSSFRRNLLSRRRRKYDYRRCNLLARIARLERELIQLNDVELPVIVAYMEAVVFSSRLSRRS